MTETKVKEEKLVRCVCGEVFDSARKKKCPGCGKKIEAVEDSGPTKAATRPELRVPSAGKGATLPSGIPAWKWVAGAVIFLVALFAFQSIVGLFQKKDPGGEAVKAVVKPQAPKATRKNSPKKRQFFPPEGTVPAQPIPQKLPKQIPAKPAFAEPALAGNWTNILNTAGGKQWWFLRIDQRGSYNFQISGAGTNTGHSGKFSAGNGKWEMVSSDRRISDKGTYRMNTKDSFTMTGSQATWQWYRQNSKQDPSVVNSKNYQNLPDNNDYLGHQNYQGSQNNNYQNVQNTVNTLKSYWDRLKNSSNARR